MLGTKGIEGQTSRVAGFTAKFTSLLSYRLNRMGSLYSNLRNLKIVVQDQDRCPVDQKEELLEIIDKLQVELGGDDGSAPHCKSGIRRQCFR